MKRRNFLKSTGVGAAAFLAGCSAERTNESTETATDTETDTQSESGGSTTTDTETDTPQGTTVESSGPQTLVVATYAPFIDAPSTSPGAWLKKRFESEFDANLVWQTPESEINYYIERANAGVDVETDVYVGLNTDMLIRVDEKLQGEGLFADASDVAGVEDVEESLLFDPKNRAIPFDTGYISLVWNATFDDGNFTAAETFDDLLNSEYEGDLIAQNPSSSATGRAFLLHSIIAKDEDGYLDYWRQLQENGVRVLGSWSDSYTAYTNGEAPMVVSYSTDQVYANRADQNMQKHQIRFLNDQGYANPEGMAIFKDTDTPELAREFLSFMLRPDIQGGIASRNVAFPATTDAELSEEYAKYAQAPPEPVTFTYDELKGSVSEWVSQWERQFASN